MNLLTWLLIAALVIELTSTWLFRRRLKEQHKMLATLYSEIAKSRDGDADKWRAKAKDDSLSNEERRVARDQAFMARANALAYRDVAGDIKHILIEGKSLASRTEVVSDEIEKMRAALGTSPAEQGQVLFMSKGGDA